MSAGSSLPDVLRLQSRTLHELPRACAEADSAYQGDEFGFRIHRLPLKSPEDLEVVSRARREHEQFATFFVCIDRSMF